MSASLWKDEGLGFADEKRQLLVMSRDHIAANLGIETDDVQDVLVSRETEMSGAADFEYAPFAQEGGLGKVYQLFGEELTVIIEALNEALAA
jgi:type I restriction enzyme R subunit